MTSDEEQESWWQEFEDLCDKIDDQEHQEWMAEHWYDSEDDR